MSVRVVGGAAGLVSALLITFASVCQVGGLAAPMTTADAGADAGLSIGARADGLAQGQSCAGWQRVTSTVRGSLTASLKPALLADGDEVAAHLARVFMWDLDLRRDVLAGDELVFLWRRSPAGEIEIGAARYVSQKLGRVLAAYRYQRTDDVYPSHFDETGQEVARRLRASPLNSYEQITALLKDRPTHAGMDWKTPVGTEVVAPKDGVVTRVNWKLRGNGNCLELRYADGLLAKFLHLSQIKVRRGGRVKAGQVIALTGNTGRSTAPHLHYQINRGRRTVDPVDYHGVHRRRLSARELPAFEATRTALLRSCDLRSALP